MSLLKNFATVGGATMASRVLGFVRDTMLAAVVGTGPVADAFVVAFRLPNLFRRLFAEGAFNSAFVPLFGRAVEEQGEAGARKLAGEIAAALLFCLLILTALAQIFMPAVVWVLAPGFIDDGQKFDLTVLMARIAFPYLIFMSLLAFISGILNTYHRFAAAAFAPVMLNIVMSGVIGTVLMIGVDNDRLLGIILCSGVAVAGIVQLAVVAWDLKRLGFSIPVFRPRYTKSARRLLALGIPGVLAGGVTQINVAVGQIIASMQDGANALLYYADRLYQLPLGVIGIAIGVVLLPSLTRQLRGRTRGPVSAQPEQRPGIFARSDASGGGRARGHSPGNRLGSVPARQVRCGCRRRYGHGACRLCLRAAGLRAQQGVFARLFRPRGHQDADVVRGHRHGGECGAVGCAVSIVQTCPALRWRPPSPAGVKHQPARVRALAPGTFSPRRPAFCER